MENTVLVALITGSLGMVTAIITTIRSHHQSKSLEKLKSELEAKKSTDHEIFKFLMSYETDTINQNFLLLKEFIQISQVLKNQIRDLNNHYDTFFIDDVKNIISQLRNKLVDQYSKSAYYFNKADTNKNGHSIKNTYLDIFDLFLKEPIDHQKINDKINEVIEKEKLLQQEIEQEIEKLIKPWREVTR